MNDQPAKLTMCEIINRFVDGEISTHQDVLDMLNSQPDPEELAARIADTAPRLCAPAQAERILRLLREDND